MVVAEETFDFEGPYISSESVADHNTPSELVSSTPSITEPTGQSELSTGLRRSSRIRRPPRGTQIHRTIVASYHRLAGAM